MKKTGFCILQPKTHSKPTLEEWRKYLQLCFLRKPDWLVQGHRGSLWQSWVCKNSFLALWAAAWTRRAPILCLRVFCRHNYGNPCSKYHCNMFCFVIEDKYNWQCCWKSLAVFKAPKMLHKLCGGGGGRHPGMSSVPFGFLQPQKELCAWAVMQNIWWAACGLISFFFPLN